MLPDGQGQLVGEAHILLREFRVGGDDVLDAGLMRRQR